MADVSHERRVLLIGWDAADWEHITPLLEEGLMPTLDALINRGVMGNLATLQPILSPMLWNSIATGKFADKHGIHGFIEPDPVNGKFPPRDCARDHGWAERRGYTGRARRGRVY